VYGIEVQQVILPVQKREHVLNIAHSSDWGGHLGRKKTQQRILSNFFYPHIYADVDRYVKDCHECQLNGRKTVHDRIPVKPFPRPERAFKHMCIDVVGKLTPKSSQGHAYVLSALCLSTKYAFATPLRNITAKSTCKAILDIMSFTGVWETVSMDNGTNFVAEETLQMLKNLGVEVRTSIPGRPQSNPVERWHGMLKSMLKKVAQSNKPSS